MEAHSQKGTLKKGGHSKKVEHSKKDTLEKAKRGTL